MHNTAGSLVDASSVNRKMLHLGNCRYRLEGTSNKYPLQLHYLASNRLLSWQTTLQGVERFSQSLADFSAQPALQEGR